MSRASSPTAILATMLVAASAAVLTGCSYFPNSGPNHLVIEHSAKESSSVEHRHIAVDYVLVDIGRKVLSAVRNIGPESFSESFGQSRTRIAPIIKIGIGDTIQITIFESAPGGLFTSGDIANRPGSFVTLPAQTVDSRGMITVPYVGQVRAAGRSVVDVQQGIESALKQRAIEPQVIITLPDQTSADVSIFGDATGNLRSRLRPGGERILELIARTGLRAAGHETFLTLNRNGKQAPVHFPNLIAKPEENIFLQPGDVIIANRVQQRFSVFGAAQNVAQTFGVNTQFSFDTPTLSLSEGVARAGGLIDQRASASHVFLYREESRDVLQRIGIDLRKFPETLHRIPTIYRANFLDPSVFFAIAQFPMRNNDIIYIANSQSVQLEKFLNHAQLVTTTASTVATDFLAVRDSFRALGN